MISGKIRPIFDSIKKRDISGLKNALYNFSENKSINKSEIESNERIKEIIEKNYYIMLSSLLRRDHFKYFIQLLDLSADLDIFIEAFRIPDRFNFLKDVYLNGIRGWEVGLIFKTLRIFNEYNLLERNISQRDIKAINEIRGDELIMNNLQDLFGKVSNSLIYYVYKSMTENMFTLFLGFRKSPEFTEERYNFFRKEQLMGFINNFMMYGLRIENLGTVEEFIDVYQKNFAASKLKEGDIHLNFIEFEFKKRLHIVSVNNLEENLKKIISNKKKYKFYNLSMVLLGGLGPEGHGFTYSTPRGEIIEICSDRRENRAIIIKYKEFLKHQFLKKLKIEMRNKNIRIKLIEKIIKFLSDILKPDEMINYFKTKVIIKQISEFLIEFQKLPDFKERELQNLLKKVSNAINIILRPIEMIDQFKCRMNLIEEGKINSEDIAKLTSLKDNSHYDVLRERFFFQTQIGWFFELYSEEILKFQK